MHKSKSSSHSGMLAPSDSESQTLFLKPRERVNTDRLRTMLRAEKLRMGSSAARDTELSMMKTKMRLVKIWWLISLWQNTRNLEQNVERCQLRVAEHVWGHMCHWFLLFWCLTGLCCRRGRRRFLLGWAGSSPWWRVQTTFGGEALVGLLKAPHNSPPLHRTL